MSGGTRRTQGEAPGSQWSSSGRAAGRQVAGPAVTRGLVIEQSHKGRVSA
jgi:hypothetical protein